MQAKQKTATQSDNKKMLKQSIITKIIAATLLALTLTAGQAGTIFAAPTTQTTTQETTQEATSIYPEADFTQALTFVNLTDYAVDGETTYFVENGNLLILSPNSAQPFCGDKRLTEYTLIYNNNGDASLTSATQGDSQATPTPTSDTAYGANGGTPQTTTDTTPTEGATQGADDPQTSDDQTLSTAILNVEIDNGNLYIATATATLSTQLTVLGDSQTPLATADYDFARSQMQQAGDHYYFFNGTTLCAYSGTITALGDNFANLKCYGDTAYAVKDNTLYSIHGTEIVTFDTEYRDFASTNSIATANFGNLLQTNFSCKLVTLNVGTYCTQVNIDSVTADYFTATATIKLEAEVTALELCRTQNASLVLMKVGGNEACYVVVAPDESKQSDYVPSQNSVTKAYTNEEIVIYACPYISQATAIGKIDSGATVEIDDYYTAEYTRNDYYKVTYTQADGAKLSGFVAARLVTPYEFSAEKAAAQTESDTPTYDNDLQRVFLILIIVGLVILAIAYLTISATKPLKSKKSSKSSKPNEIDIDPE